MKRPGTLVRLVVLFVVVAGFSSVGVATASSTVNSVVRTTWVEPADGYSFLDAAIDAAHRSIDLSMYELRDPTIENDLIGRARAGVNVRVLLDSAYNGQRDNAGAYATLRASQVHVEWAPSGQIFHAKYLVVDAGVAYIGTGNLDSADYSSTRDFWVLDSTSSDVMAIARTFSADFDHSGAAASASGGLVWSPGSTSTLVALIDSARHSLWVENEEMDSASIEQALGAAARRGVAVHLVMTEDSSWSQALASLSDQGVHVRTLDAAQVYIHAKVICVDCSTDAGEVFIGSENFSTSSLSYNRELGVITTSRDAVGSVLRTLSADYALATTATSTPPSRSTTTPSTGGLSLTHFEASISPGQEDTLSVHTASPNARCSLVVTLPSGYTSESRGLGDSLTNAAGDAAWTWMIGTSTRSGTAYATVTCGVRSLRRAFTIT